MPSAFSARTISPVARVSSGDMPAVGSSSSSSLRFQAYRHADLQPLLLAVAEIAGRLRCVGLRLRKSSSRSISPRRLDSPRCCWSAISRFCETLSALKIPGHLELDADAAPDSVERLQAGDVFARVEDLPADGGCSPRIRRNKRALARAVRADQAVDLAGFQRKVDIGGDLQAAEMLVEPARSRGAPSGRLPSAPPHEPAAKLRRHDEPFRRDQHGQHQQQRP